MKIRKELIGSSVYCKKTDSNLVIKLGNEKLYKSLGLDVFELKSKENEVRTKGGGANKGVHIKRVNNRGND